jgi:tetratricopeptide (TPR) repeat protein
MWSQTFSFSVEDVFRVQQDVAERIGQALRVELLANLSSQSTPPAVKSDALEAYLRGRHHWNQRTEPALNAALQSFQQAVAADPSYARAYCGIADCYLMLTWFGAVRPHQSAPKSRAAAARALELDGELGEAYCSSAMVRFWYEWDWKSAEREFQQAISLSPNYATAHHWRAAFLVTTGRLDEAAREFTTAQELDPLSLMSVKCLGDPALYARDYDRAIAHYTAVVDKEPRFAPAYFDLGRAQLYAGQPQSAVVAFGRAFELSGNYGALPALACAHAGNGNAEEARKLLDELLHMRPDRYIPAALIAGVYTALGDVDSAFSWLETAVAERCFWLVFLAVDPIYDRLRADPRFDRLLTSVGFKNGRAR